MNRQRFDIGLLGAAGALAVLTIVIAQIGWVGPQVAIIGNVVAATIVVVLRNTVRSLLNPQSRRSASTAARRVTEVIAERS